MDKILIVDYGSQYHQLISRRIRERHVYSEVVSSEELLIDSSVKGIILSGGPSSVYDEDAPKLPRSILDSGVPVLGICYGMQLMVYNLGGEVKSSHSREYGKSQIAVKSNSTFTMGL